MTRRERAPAKVNLVLHVGPRRADGLHELCSLFASIDLADEIVVEQTGSADRVICRAVAGENLAARALDAFRRSAPGVALPPLRISIDKRIPVAAGLGGGSADAAAVLRVANELAGEPLDASELRAVAATLGSDVPSQVEPMHALVSGLGERVEPIGELPPMSLVLVAQAEGLSTGTSYAELDRLRAGGEVPDRQRLDPEPLRHLAIGSARELAAGMENDLEAAALSLRPELADVLTDLRARGALAARVTGSGPTTFGVFADRSAAGRAAAEIEGGMVVETSLR